MMRKPLRGYTDEINLHERARTLNSNPFPCDVSTVCQFIVHEDIELAAEFKGKDNPNALNQTTYLPIVTLP